MRALVLPGDAAIPLGGAPLLSTSMTSVGAVGAGGTGASSPTMDDVGASASMEAVSCTTAESGSTPDGSRDGAGGARAEETESGAPRGSEDEGGVMAEEEDEAEG
ncbi:hypothetical protein PHYPSEUDO_012390 [Phytophthora pseudosyringae]|uniref:Uncharacterized protein n=1 Tax=Phytophthora pseudosyringae TaxID=221518 RepID=A0A8T1VBN7_9STRA|nr:hypothetical protein PHYPSEUDO_012390 [Phytophthora pseudosyringae]